MTWTFYILTVATLIVSGYLSFACFNIVRRMRQETPWVLALIIIAIAGLGAYAFLESLSSIALWVIAQYSVLYVHVSPEVAISSFIAAYLIKSNPRIDTW